MLICLKKKLFTDRQTDGKPKTIVRNLTKINLSKVILKLECLFYLNIYILFYFILYSKIHFDSNKCKKRSNRKKKSHISVLCKDN